MDLRIYTVASMQAKHGLQCQLQNTKTIADKSLGPRSESITPPMNIAQKRMMQRTVLTSSQPGTGRPDASSREGKNAMPAREKRGKAPR